MAAFSPLILNGMTEMEERLSLRTKGNLSGNTAEHEERRLEFRGVAAGAGRGRGQARSQTWEHQRCNSRGSAGRIQICKAGVPKVGQTPSCVVVVALTRAHALP